MGETAPALRLPRPEGGSLLLGSPNLTQNTQTGLSSLMGKMAFFPTGPGDQGRGHRTQFANAKAEM